MCRVNLNLIGKFQKLFMQAVVKHSRHLLRREAFAARKIRTPNIADEERVTG